MTESFLPHISDPLPRLEQWPPTIELRRADWSISEHLRGLRTLAGAPMLPPERHGRCVLTVGGGKYWLGIVIGIRLLRESDCTLPVEVWYRGSIEPANPADVRDLGDVRLMDVEVVAREQQDNRVQFSTRERGGWETKLYALTHTTFREVLFLDADAYCVSDPAPLFDLLRDDPFVFWSDLPHMEGCVKWPRVWPAGDNGTPTVQGGQLVIDTAGAWRLLVLAHWMCQHSDYYFGAMYGDQDTWRVGLAAEACGALCLGAADWEQPAFVCRYQKRAYIVHRCQSKLFTDLPGVRADSLPREARVWELFAALAA